MMELGARFVMILGHILMPESLAGKAVYARLLVSHGQTLQPIYMLCALGGAGPRDYNFMLLN